MIEWLRQALVIATVECRLHVLSPAWRMTVMLTVILTVVAVLVGVQTLERQRNEVDVLSTSRAEAAEEGQHVVSGFQRDEALRGIRPIAPARIFVHSGDGTQYLDPGPDGPTVGMVALDQGVTASALDVEFILRAIIGLLAAVIGAGSLVAADHRGTSKSLVSLPVHPAALMAGGLAGGLAAIALAAAGAIVIAVVTERFASPVRTPTSILGTAASLWLATIALGAALQGLGSIAALRARTAAGALSGAVTAWLIVAIVGSPIVNAVASSVAPLPPRTLFEAERFTTHRNAVADLEFAIGDLVQRDLGSAGVQPGARLEGSLLARVKSLWDLEVVRLRHRLDDLEAGRRRKEAHSAKWTTWLSAPLAGALFRSAAAELADVGAGSARQWQRETDAYQVALNEAVFDRRPRINFRVRRDAGAFSTYFHDRSPRLKIADLPVFAPQSRSFRTQFRDAAPSLALLGLHGAISWVIAMLAFARGHARHGD